MPDIKLTLSKNRRRYAANIDEEIEFLRANGTLWYPLTAKGRPRNVFLGNRVYFILGREVVGRAIIDAIEPPQPVVLKTYRNKDIAKGSWGARISKIEKPKRSISTLGFQSFRYGGLGNERYGNAVIHLFDFILNVSINL